MKGYRIVTLLVCLYYQSIIGQDYQFSQYNSSPININPALTGFFTGDYRATLHFRSQWGSFTDAYRTTTGSFEITALKGRLKHDHFGIGLQGGTDRAGSTKFGSNTFSLFGSFKKNLGRYVKHGIGIGFQAGFLQYRMNTDELIFDSQYNGVEIDPTLPVGEQVSGSSKGSFDLGAGLVYQIVPNEFLNMYFGGSVSHIIEPQLNFLLGGTSQLNRKYIAHAGASINASRLINILPSAIFVTQGPTFQVMGGSYLQFILNDYNDAKTAFAIGAWGRVAEPVMDAIIFGARIDYQNFVFSMTYDYNISKLNTVSRGRGGYELSLLYIGKFNTAVKRSLQIPCPQL